MAKQRAQQRSLRNPAARGHEAQALLVLRSFRVIFGSVRQHFREVEKRCGVSGSQLWILREVQREPGVGVSALAIKLGIHQSTCSQLVDKLVRGGYIGKFRSREDQRRVGLKATRRGGRTIACAPGPAEGLLPEALGELSASSLRSLNLSLKKLIRHMDLQASAAADEPLASM